MHQCIETLGGTPDLENRFVLQSGVAQVELDCPPKTSLGLPVVFHFPGKSPNRTFDVLALHFSGYRVNQDLGTVGRERNRICNVDLASRGQAILI
jgi:hypothetical protein